MLRETKNYGHFCMLARALEILDDRWAMLVIRDLLVGRRRFTDLQRRLGGITAKTLTQRMTDLETNGLVSVEREAGRRDVWYELTAKGAELGPALDELTAWGLRNLKRPPNVGEPTHPEHILSALRVVLSKTTAEPKALSWQFNFSDHNFDERSYGLVYDLRNWELVDGDPARPNLKVSSTPSAFAAFFTSIPKDRDPLIPSLTITASAVHRQLFLKLCSRFPFGLD
jgi:DNA-binding HxlR family transcriptional regulator